MRRRALLAGIGSLATLTGCLGSGGAGTPTDSPTDTPTQDPTGTTTETPTPDPTATATPTPTPGPSTELVNGSFEEGLAGWAVDRDVPDQPGNPGTPIESRAEVTDERAKSGSKAVRFFLDGSADDGTVWVQQPVDLSGYETLSVSVYNDEASFNTVAQVAAYAGPLPAKGLSEAEFDRSNAADGHDGWTALEYPVDHDGEGVVAVGMNVVWETGVAHVYDDVTLS